MSARRRLLLLLALWTSTTSAEDASVEAKRLFEQGLVELEAGRHEEALDSFLKSRAQKPTRANTQNAALTMKRLGRYDEALELLRRMPEEFPGMTAAQREAVLAEIAQLESSTGLIEVESDALGASVVVAGRARGQVPLAEPVRVNPGQHSVRIEKDGRVVASALVQVAAGGRVRAVPTAPAEPPSAPAPAQAPAPVRPPAARAPAAPAAPSPWGRLRVGLGAGFLIPGGNTSRFSALSSVADTGYALEVDAGYSPLDWLELGAYYSAGEPTPGERCERGEADTVVRCSPSVTRVGVMLDYRITRPTASLLPYLGLGFGYDRIEVERDVESASGTADEGYFYSNYGPRAQLGFDVALSPMFLLGQRCGVSFGSYTGDSTHWWVDLSVRLSIRLLER